MDGERTMRFYNTLTRRLEAFTPLEPGRALIYTCGPTVYDFPHIGNFRAYVWEDLLRRLLKHRGFAVTQVMNITDVEDKTIRGARAAGVELHEYTEKYIRGFFEDIPRELEPAARMDGCTRFGAFFRIVLPLARGGIMATAIYVFIACWGEFFIPLVVTFSKATTLTVFASAFGGLHEVNYGAAAATAVMSGVPSIFLALFFRRYLIRGLLEGSVKK